jgi:hypothetical protein
MQFILNNIFYFGVFIIIGIFVWLFILRFKEDDDIDLKDHLWIIILYLVLMILAIFTWRIIYLLIISNYEKFLKSMIHG